MSMSSIGKYRERVRSIENTPEFLLEEVKLAFAEELSRLLEEQGISRRQLAERLGTSRAYVTRILRTDYNLTAETMVKVARALDARVSLRLQPAKALPQRTTVGMPASHRKAERPEFVAADRRSARVRRSEFTTSDKPARRKA